MKKISYNRARTGLMACAAAALLAGGAAYAAWIFTSMPDPALLESNRVAQSTKIYDRTGDVLLYEIHGEEKRTVLPYEEIPHIVKSLTIVLEDKNFYGHAAVDWRSVLRAMIANIMNAGVVQGGSTITQQLAKNAFLAPDRTITRKLKELIIAYRLEKKFSKDEILALYLNQIPYGANAYGIEAAAQTYFNKHARDLSIAEAATLASLPKAPSFFSPWGPNKDRLMARKNYAIDELFAQGIINAREHAAALLETIAFAPQATGIKAPHFTLAVQEYLINTYGENVVRSGGLTVITTLDWPMQQAAERAVADGARRNAELYKGKNAALVAQNPKTGEILALVGSRDYFDESIDGNFNVAMQGLRQPGSSIKPFAYITAFAKGYAPETVLFDVPTEFDTSGDPARSYKPHNFDGEFRGPVSLRSALAQSINVPSVKVLYLAGMDAVLQTAKAMGITTLNERNRYGLSLALGGGEVKLIDMAQAYATLAADGVYKKQSLIVSVTDAAGRVLEKTDRASERVVSAQAARLINDILSDTEARKPLFHSSINLTLFPGREVALKTGTTNDYRDAWAFGYTPSLVVGVWAGNSDNKPMERQGGSILAAIPIWSAFMKSVINETPAEEFPRPAPTIAINPVLGGHYAINNEIHTILYHINRKNPLEGAPLNPERDPQFKNWEQGIADWIAANPNAVASGAATEPLAITIASPVNGSFITEPFDVKAAIISKNAPLVEISTTLNGINVHTQTIAPASQYTYITTIHAPLHTQNKITVTAKDSQGNTHSKDIIVFQ